MPRFPNAPPEFVPRYFDIPRVQQEHQQLVSRFLRVVAPASGDILYGGSVDSQETFVTLSAGATHSILTIAGGVPTWATTIQATGYDATTGTSIIAKPTGHDAWIGATAPDTSHFAGVTFGQVGGKGFGWYVDNNVTANVVFTTNDTPSTLVFKQSGEATFVSSVKTGAPNTGTAAPWKFGSYKTAGVTFDNAHYIELDVNGTLYKVGVVT